MRAIKHVCGAILVLTVSHVSQDTLRQELQSTLPSLSDPDGQGTPGDGAQNVGFRI